MTKTKAKKGVVWIYTLDEFGNRCWEFDADTYNQENDLDNDPDNDPLPTVLVYRQGRQFYPTIENWRGRCYRHLEDAKEAGLYKAVEWETRC